MSRFLFPLLVFSMVSLTGCNALQQQRLNGPGWYMVKQTDTLYSVAWRYGLDYQQLAEWNGIADPYVIHPGQQLILIQPATLPAVTMPAVVAEPTTDKAPSTPRPVVVKKLDVAETQQIIWRWPTEGDVLNRFSYKELDKRGIDIAGKVGQPVFAVADGKVVYSGTGLADYGNLIIVKHNSTYLSAYAYNSGRLVKEGDPIKIGAHIADMGTGKDNKPMLHFQIRKKGKPVDPLLYLPENI
ncbi:MAG: peptidoglycan DD-metalloendopeptidase family protein [Gammaproteobacteria bacterium]|nr:peptidoglycan DD-metalloendopeptidase family protein [Gammaproteobacteria bacterium]